MSEPAVRQRPGPKPRFTQDDLTDAAFAIVDAEGFDALSLRAVARELGVTSMAIYTYVRSRDELYGLVVDRLISTKLAEFVWPQRWPEALHQFAGSLSGLIEEHPALIQAFAEGQMRTELAASVAQQMLELLLAGGLSVSAAQPAYASMHALVLGHAVLREAAKSDGALGDPQTLDAAAGRPVDVALHEMLDLLIAGIEHKLRDDRHR